MNDDTATCVRAGILIGLVACTACASASDNETNAANDFSKDFVESEISLELSESRRLSSGGLAVFVSPQYANDHDIQKSVRAYLSSVRRRLGWSTLLIRLDSTTNTVESIDRRIEKLASRAAVGAVLMIGEDTKTPLFVEDGTQETPMLSVWADTNGELTSYTCEGCSCCKDYTPEIAVSLLYPNSLDSYTTKKEQIRSALEKFSAPLPSNLGNAIQVHMSEEFTAGAGNQGFGFSAYGKLARAGELTFTINPIATQIDDSLNATYKIFAAEGHANHYLTRVHDNGFERPFFATDLHRLSAPLYLSNGCFTGGWGVGANAQGNGQLDPPEGHDYWGRHVLTNPMLRAEANSGQGPAFTYCAADLLAAGKTIAEAYIQCDSNAEGVILFGDPTLAFPPFSAPAASDLEVWQDDVQVRGNARQGVATAIDVGVRNTGTKSATADVIVYDVTNHPEVFGAGSKVYPRLVDGRRDLEICRAEGLAVDARGASTIPCTLTPQSFLNYVVVRVFDRSNNEAVDIDNGNVVIVVAP